MKQLLRACLMLAVPVMVAACNTDYNFDNVSLEVTVGDTEGISVPLGSTGEITLHSLLEESGIETDENGNYGFEFEDSMSHTLNLGTIAPITGLAPTIDPTTLTVIGDINAAIPTFEASKALSLPEGLSANMDIPEGFPLIGQEFLMHYDPHTFESEFTMELPNEIAAIKTIRFGTDGNGSTIAIKFNLGGVAGVSQKRTIEKFNIELPAGFTIDKVAGEDTYNYTTVYAGEGSTTNNHFHIENYEMTGDELSIKILVKSADLSAVTIGTDNTITISENVTYDLDFTGSLKAGTVSAVSPEVSVVANLAIYDATIVTGEISHAVEVMESISEVIELPQEIKEIHNIAVCDNTTGGAATINLGLTATNLPIDYIELQDVEITLPSYLSIVANESWTSHNGVLSIPSIKIGADGWSESFEIYEISNIDIQGGIADLSAEVGIKANVVIPSGQQVTIALHQEDVVITPTLDISDIKVHSLTGIIEPDLGDLLEPIEVSLGDFTSSLEGLEMDLNIASPVLLLEVDNPIGVGIDATLNIEAYKGGAVAQTITTPTISILPSMKTSIIITGEGSEVAYPDDASTLVYKIEGLSEMIGLLPEKLLITLDAETNKQKPHTIVLQDSYTFNVAYRIDAPFSFSNAKDGHISYTTTIEDVDLGGLKDIDVTIESLMVNIASESSLPIDLSLALEMLDAEGNAIESITATTTGLIEGTTEATAATAESTITLTIDAPEGSTTFAEVAKINKIRCTLEGTTLSGGSLNKNQYIDLGLSLLLPEGITVDLATLGGGNDQSTEGEGE